MCRNNILNSSFFYLPPVMHIVVKLVESLHLCALIEQINEQHIIKYQTAQCLRFLPFNIKSCSGIQHPSPNCNLDFLFSLTRAIKNIVFFFLLDGYQNNASEMSVITGGLMVAYAKYATLIFSVFCYIHSLQAGNKLRVFLHCKSTK